MRKMNRIAAVAVLAFSSVGTFGTVAVGAADDAEPSEVITISGTCEDDYDLETSGARAGASLWCDEGRIHIDGWVKDTAADGQCAEVNGRIGNRVLDSPNACPKGEKKYFSYDGKGSTAEVRLREF